MFVLQKCIKDFDRAREHVQALEKYFNTYYLDPFSSLFLGNDCIENNVEEDNEYEISMLKEQAKILHDESMSLHYHNDK